ncbi:hypothetical protein SMACR_08876 [Sordaria macrospora]|uniref:Uncharacterized protein n=1 Tax=Sordaria macrospora TaxID=5147 RepID=A0A8S8ZAE0_SORMA|nr:hypothetical protein SMACR_08876 [Sordaria macrospora]
MTSKSMTAAPFSAEPHRPCIKGPSTRAGPSGRPNSTSSGRSSSSSSQVQKEKIPKLNWSWTNPKNGTTFRCSTGSERGSDGNSSSRQTNKNKNQKRKQNRWLPKGYLPKRSSPRSTSPSPSTRWNSSSRWTVWV